MANQVLVSPLLELVSDKLTNLIEKDFGVVWGVEKQMKKLSKTLFSIIDVLNDAEEKQVSYVAIQNWLKELKDVVYAAEDVFDDWALEGLQLAPETSNNFFIKVTDAIKELIDSVDEIAKEIREFDLQKGVVENRPKICPSRETSSLLIEPQVYGRKKDKENLVRLLLGQYRPQHSHPSGGRPLPNSVKNHKHISICPIVGIGGIGKTTLAQLLYKDDEVVKHFEVRSWVCVSEDFDVKRLIGSIIISITGKACGFDELDTLQERLQEELRGKRFLLVLDDVWEDNQDEWNKLKGTLACGGEGSCVIVTTRLKTVASITGTIRPCCLKVLSEDDCWSLFKQQAFDLEIEERLDLKNEERSELMEIGKDIVKKCGGIPLAAKALGALLRFKRKPSDWLFVRDSDIWQLPENNILPALLLSYKHLPSHLRQCFSYCSIFPKDYNINRKELIQLWVANGFVPSKERMELEDVGNEIFEALLWRSFFQEITKDEDGNIETCKMHDLVHDLAYHIMRDECSTVDIAISTRTISRRTRHASLIFNKQTSSFKYLGMPKFRPCLRSLIVQHWGSSIKECQFIFSRLIRLRALELSDSSITVLPDTIGNMKHLRYLNLSRNYITSLPGSICELRNIEILNLAGCGDLGRLPTDMREMSSLKHLDIRKCYGLTEMPIGMGKLTRLQTLRFFIVGLESGRGINELGGLNIGGELGIEGLENVKNLMDSKEANLIAKENLRSLQLTWSIFELQENENATEEEVMEGLQPHPNLRRFSVYWYRGVTFPSWFTVSSLPKLVEIELSDCRRCEHLPPLKRLPLLKVLKIRSLSSVKFIDEDKGAMKGGFMSLEQLELEWMLDLEGWSSSSFQEGEGDQRAASELLFPCLKILVLEACPKLTGISLPYTIESVTMWKCSERVLGSLQNLPRLSSLEIEGFDDLVHFPQGMLQNLTALQKLTIHSCFRISTLPVELESLTTLIKFEILNCRELVSLARGLKMLSSLRSLYIENCARLKYLPELEKSCLVHLEIRNCPEMKFSMEEDFKHLAVLQRLRLFDLPKLTCFPEGIKHARMLQHLSIVHCSEDVMDLPDWIGTVTSLQSLIIHGCKNRKVLPEGLQHLTALLYLNIRGCDAELERRYKTDNVEDWYKIAHIPLFFNPQTLPLIRCKTFNGV